MKKARVGTRRNTPRIARRQFRRRLMLESLESRHMLASDWQNPLFNLDVNDDGDVNPLDVLEVINDINSLGSRLLPPRDESGANYLDCDGDGYVAPIDVLVIINAINAALPSPTIDLVLHSDNGFSSSDLITNDPRIKGTAITGGLQIESAKVRVNRDKVVSLPFDSSGKLQFDPRIMTKLTDGEKRIAVAVKLATGGTGLRHLHFTYDATAPAFVPPRLLAADDTGLSNSDNVTKITNPRLKVEAEIGSQLVVQFGGQTLANQLSAGSWETQLSPLTDGDYEVSASATDVAGNISQTDFPIIVTIDTLAPPATPIDLAATSDTGVQGDRETGAARVTLVGTTERNAIVSLDGIVPSARAANNGKFHFPNIAIANGANVLTSRVVDLAGNIGPSTQTTITRVVETGGVDPVLLWNNAALAAIRLDATDPPMASRYLAMLSQAVFDVANAIDGNPGLVVYLPVPIGMSAEAAVSSAAFEILKYAYPAQQISLAAVLNTALSQIVDGPSKTSGVAFGQSIARIIIALRESDGWDAFVHYVPREIVGQWRTTSPMFAPALLPQWENLQTFVIGSADALVPAGPPELTSAEYTRDLKEVAAVGRAGSTSRTADQMQIARFWADGPGTTTPVGHWNSIASQAAQSVGSSWGENARLFAELNLALGDAAIVAWKAKYAHEFWRPITAIQQADRDENPQTIADSTWSPLLISPPFPEYVSGHSTFSGAASKILTSRFGSSFAFTTESPGLPNVQRSFTSFDAAAEEAGRSRVYGGIHFEFSNRDGQTAGKAVAEEVLSRLSNTTDVLPPKIVFTSPKSAIATNINPRITGWTIDNLSGVRGLQAAIDGGSYTSVGLESDGRFSLQTQLVLNGSQDGVHVVHFRAIDHAGLISPVSDFQFTLDTVIPTVAIEGLTAGATINASTVLAGTANGTGSSITSLAYRIDTGPMMPIAFDRSTGRFNQKLDLSRVAVGAHTLTVIASDAAGLVGMQSLNVQLATAIPFVIESTNPLAGASDVGTTIRPQVFFSRPVNVSSLNATNFYATGPDGEKLAARIVPAADGSFAWLFFEGPMPSGALVTLHVDGTTITAAADGALLDANADGLAGGKFTNTYRTVSLMPLLGTSLSGKVVDPGPDLSPMTFDDIRAGADGRLHSFDDVFLAPLAGVKVFILGLENQVAVTDAAGNFRFDSVPAGNIKLAIDGRTATNVPAGIYFPEMVMDLTLRAGVENTVMGTMGTLDQQLANADRVEVYLPRLNTTILQPISETETTTLSVASENSPGLTDEQRSRLTISVPPGRAIGHDGQPIIGGQIGISTVPPELVREMLPPGLLQHTFDITIQAPGIDRFTTPVPMTFPNLVGSAPGSQLNFLSFDHATGRLVIEGTATVSADGLTASTDPGMGITHPGWHGLLPPGTEAGSEGGGCPPSIIGFFSKPPIDVKPIPITLGVQDYFFSSDEGQFTLSFGNAAAPVFPGFDACDSPNSDATPLVVEISVDGATSSFLQGLSNQTFILYPGQQHSTKVDVKKLLTDSGINFASKNTLYGAVVNIKGYQLGKTDLLLDRKIFVYRFLDIADDDHSDRKIDFEKSLVDSFGVAYQSKDLALSMPVDAYPTTSALNGFHFPVSLDNSNTAFRLRFDPLTLGDLKDTLQFVSPSGTNLGTIELRGKAIDKQVILFNRDGFNQSLAKLVDAGTSTFGIGQLFPPDGTDDGAAQSDEQGFQIALDKVYNDVVAHVKAIYFSVNALVGSAISIVDGSDGAGQLLTYVLQSDTPGTNVCGNIRTPACAIWADFSKEAFGSTKPPSPGTIVAQRSSTSDAQEKWLFDRITNRSFSDDESGRNLTNNFNLDILAGYVVNAPNNFSILVANSIAHEVTHNLGAIHLRDAAKNYIVGDRDIMGSAGSGQATTTFRTFAPLVKLALGVPANDTEFRDLFKYYKTYVPLESYDHNNEPVHPASNPDDILLDVPILTVFEQPLVLGSPLPASVESIQFSSTVVDGIGSIVTEREITLFNDGGHPLDVSSVQILEQNSGYSIASPDFPVSLEPIDPDDIELNASSHRVLVRFDPTIVGEHSATLRIASNDATSEWLDIPLSGNGQSPFGDIRVEMTNNNFGGRDLNSASAPNASIVTLRNVGATTLSITAVTLDPNLGATEFTVSGLPAGLSLTQPLVIVPGNSHSFEVRFEPDSLGLRRGIIKIQSNDPETPTFRQNIVGTGLVANGAGLDYGDDYVVVQTHLIEGAPALRQRSDSSGNFSVFLPRNEAVHYAIFDPVSGLISSAFDVTSGNATTDLPTPFFLASIEHDGDGDGLPDDIEFAVGTGLSDTDTDNDGLSDYVEIMQGLDPLGGKGLPTGIVAAAALSGQAFDVIVEGSLTDPNVQTAFVATGPHGLAIVDVSQPDKPVVLSELNLSGFNSEVAVDLGRNLAAMAAGASGVHLVDISDFKAPSILATIPVTGSASQLELSGGIAYVVVGSAVVSIDVDSRAILQTLQFDRPITDIALDGSALFILDNNSMLKAITLDDSNMTLRGSLQILQAKGKFAVGDGIAYVPAARGQPPSDGFVTVDVSNPSSLTLLGESTRPPLNFASLKNDFAVTGSGLGLKFDEQILGPGLPVGNALNLYVVADPIKTNEFVTRILLPDLSRGLTIATGFAFVADDLSDLQIVNFQPLDTMGQSPIVNASTKEADRDPVTPGVQVRSGAKIRVDAKVLDDVLVRNVELLVNGQVIRNDASFPWDLVATAPITNQPTTLLIQARATDTGGNVGLSNLLTLEVIPDLVAPALIGTSPIAGQVVPRVDQIDLLFDEALDVNLLNASGVTLTNLGPNNLPGGGDDVIVAIGSLSLRDLDRTLRLVPSIDLKVGQYRLAINPSILADVAGNHVLEPVLLSFSIPAGNPLVAVRGIPANPTLPSANVGQEFSFVMPWAPELARTKIVQQFQDTRIVNNQVIENAGDRFYASIPPRRSDLPTRTAFFRIHEAAITDEAAVFGGGHARVTDLPNWKVKNGEIELYGQDANGNNFQNEIPGNGLYVDLGNSAFSSAMLESKDVFQLTPGEYELRFDLAGARFSIATESVVVSLGSSFNETFSRPALSLFTNFTRTISVAAPVLARLVFDQVGGTNQGLHLDNVKLSRVDSGTALLDDHFDLPFGNGNFLLQIVPTLDSVDVLSVSSNGINSFATIAFRGSGIIEGENTTYRFGDVTMVDTSFTAGPDVRVESSTIHSLNAYATLTLPLSDAAFGAITVSTAGGRSDFFSVNVASITAQALSGTPANPALLSANPGQSITLHGNGLKISTDMEVQYHDENGRLRSALINPTSADFDGTSAQVLLPNFVNGVIRLRIFGASAIYSIQIVPVVHQGNMVFRPAPEPSFFRILGRGFYEDDSTYDFGGQLVFDSELDNTAEVGGDVVGNGSAELVRSIPENTSLTITTPGGTSAPVIVSVPIPIELPAPTISGIVSTALDGIPANVAIDSANTGQVITVQGTNFRLDSMQVVFPTRNESGIDGVEGVAPLAVNDAGTLAQVRVPDLATTGSVKVTRIGSRNVGLNSAYDAIHRSIEFSFTPKNATTELRFTDGGLSGLAEEGWGIDNVLVSLGATVIFTDDFQSSDRPEWSRSTTTTTPGLSRFSGPYSSAVQKLTLTGLTAGALHTLRFDLYVLDTWDGLMAGFGPDRFIVRADDETIFDEAFSNDLAKTQTYVRGSGVALQIVPTITRTIHQEGNGYDGGLQIFGSGFMEGASTIAIGGVEVHDRIKPDTADVSLNPLQDSGLDPVVFYASKNKQYGTRIELFTLDGPIRVTTAGGHYEIAGPNRQIANTASVNKVDAVAEEGKPHDLNLPSANTGQYIRLNGAFSLAGSKTVQLEFQAIDDTGKVGTVTRDVSPTGNESYGREWEIAVPELARTGMVRVLGTSIEFFLQVVPTLRDVGPVTPGMVTVLEGTGLLQGDLTLSVDGQPVENYTVQSIRDENDRQGRVNSFLNDRQIVTFTVPTGVTSGAIKAVSSGGTAMLRTGVAAVSGPPLTPNADVGDTLGNALQVTTTTNGRLTIASALESRLAPTIDEDFYQFSFESGERIVFDLASASSTSSSKRVNMQLQDAGGVILLNTATSSNSEVRLEYTVPRSGNYFLKVFDRNVGLPAENYQVYLRRLDAHSTVLTGIAATAEKGTPLHSGIASVNVGQVITLFGNGLRINDRIVFNKGLVDDTRGYVVAPLSVSSDGTSLTVQLPSDGRYDAAGNADSKVNSGIVQLVSDAVGLYLQVVPTVEQLGASVLRFVTLFGSGFDYPAIWQVGDQSFATGDDAGHNLAGLPLGPISVTTVGGTISVLDAPDMVSIAASATLGVPANSSLPSANPGQTIVVNGSRLKIEQRNVSYPSSLIFQTIDSAGGRGEIAVAPTTASPDGTSMTVVVPKNAMTGPVGIMGDPQGTSLILQIVPVVTSIIPSTTTVQVNGKGLIEGDTLYRFGELEVLDGSNSTAGADVNSFFSTNESSLVSIAVGGSGILTVKTAGGTSAPISYGAMVAARTAPRSAIRSATSNRTPETLQAFATETIAALDSNLPGSFVPNQTPSLMWEIRDLPGDTLGFASGNTIYLDTNAAGWGWFIDPTPMDDSEFHVRGNQGEQDRMDLFTVVMHELGHAIGLDHTDDGAMTPALEPGTRHALSDEDYESLADHLFSLDWLDRILFDSLQSSGSGR